eukprot:1606161-Alexandrium_andersonii.AAC.1
MGVFDFRRFGAVEKAMWPIGRAGTTAPSGWILGPELTLTRHEHDRLGVPTYETGAVESLRRPANDVQQH